MNVFLRYRNTIIAVLMMAVFSLIIYSIYTHYSEQLQDLKVKRLKLQNGKKVIARWEAVQQKYGLLRRSLLGEDTGMFKQFIEEKARLSDIYITSLNMGVEDKNVYWEVSSDFEAECFYRNLIKFLRLLEEKKVSLVSVAIYKRKPRGQPLEGIGLLGHIEGIVVK